MRRLSLKSLLKQKYNIMPARSEELIELETPH